jgi:hypothetical protein
MQQNQGHVADPLRIADIHSQVKIWNQGRDPVRDAWLKSAAHASIWCRISSCATLGVRLNILQEARE